MHKLIMSLGVAAVLGLAAMLPGAAQAAPGGLSRPLSRAAVDLNIVEDAQYIYGGRNYCFYLNGWRGPGWYWCGYAWRRGYGWGGPRGWRNWAWHGQRSYRSHRRVYRGGHYRSGSRTVIRQGRRGGSRTVIRQGRGGSRAVIRQGGGGRQGQGGGRRQGGGGHRR